MSHRVVVGDELDAASVESRVRPALEVHQAQPRVLRRTRQPARSIPEHHGKWADAALRHARKRGALVSFDPNIRIKLWETDDEMRETISMAMSCADIALPSFDDEMTYWSDASPQATIERFSNVNAA